MGVKSDQVVNAELIYKDDKYDAAIIKIDPKKIGIQEEIISENGEKFIFGNLKPIVLDIKRPKKGERVIAIGNFLTWDAGSEEKNKYGIRYDALIEKTNDGKYLDFNTKNNQVKQYLLVKYIFTKINDKEYCDSNGQILIKKNNGFHYKKDNKKITGVLIKDNNENFFTESGKKLDIKKDDGKFFLNDLEIKDANCIAKWTDNGRELYVDFSKEDLFIDLDKKESKKSFGVKNLITRNGKKYCVGEYLYQTISSSIGVVKSSDCKVKILERSGKKSKNFNEFIK